MSQTSAPSKQKILHIAIPTPVADTFDYLPPAEIKSKLIPGCRILVPFGRRKVTGVLVNLSDSSQIESAKLRHALEIIDSTPILQSDLLDLAWWANRYYHHPLGEVIHSMLPASLRQGKTAGPPSIKLWQRYHQDNAASMLKRAPKQLAVYNSIASVTNGLNEKQLSNRFQNWRPAIKELEKKGLLRQSEVAIAPDTITHSKKHDPAVELNREQDQIVQNINEQHGSFSTWLIDGVTGSGKTEVYLQIIKQALLRGEQCLVLVPEIGLTPQLLDRFSSQLNARVVAWHSGLTDQQRFQIWYAAGKGDAGVIIGTRSAVFLPLAKPGLIVIDEEHDSSLKQQDGFRYHARDLAIVRAQQLDIPIVLGSATPSLESLNNALQKRYQLQQLHERAGGAQLPKITLLDNHNAKAVDVISQAMLQAIHSHLQKGSQVLLFLNRRGYAPVLYCNQCGWTSECQRCDAHMTLHQSEQVLRCHHCGHTGKQPQKCPGCSSESLQTIGIGTEQLEQYLKKQFPNNSVLRIDRDAVKRKGALEKHLEQARMGAVDILLGTQMLSKGHHFPKVTLVGILGIDQALFSADFRGPEFMAQQILQVSGRAGRAKRKGEVLIETRLPQHPLLRLLVIEGYRRFAEAALIERKQAALPPYTYLVLFRAEAVSSKVALQFLDHLAVALAANLSAAVQLLGPVPAPMERRAGRFRAQLLLQSENRQELHHTTHALRKIANASPLKRKVRWSIDVDPIEML